MLASGHERSGLLLHVGCEDARAVTHDDERQRMFYRRSSVAASLALLMGACACGLLFRSSGRAEAAPSRGLVQAYEEHAELDNGTRHAKHLKRRNYLRELALNETQWGKIKAALPRSADEVKPARAGGDVEPVYVVTDDEPIDLGCSDTGEDCSKTRCCNDEGLQCYQKNQWWATCMPKCSTAGGNWTCKEFGERAPLATPGSCSEPGDNCAITRCCTEAGMRCYSMDDFATWSSCAYDCQAGVGWAANWTCEALGDRAPDPLGCSWSGEACIHNRLCCHEGQKCLRKNSMEAYCTHEERDDWDGEVLGGSRNEWAVQPVEQWEARGTSLFCIMAVLPGSYEEQLRDLAASKGTSIFACDAHACFSTWKTEFVEEGSWQSVVNTDVFKSVWQQVNQDGQYQGHDWTVKVDADSVFLPDRLRFHLGNMSAPKDMPIYIKNAEIDFGFLGAIEVLSKEALDKLFWDDVLDKCEGEVGTHSGEDGYLKGCLDMIGAGFIEDDDVLRDPAAADCTDPARVCFHAFKDVESWERCFAETR